MKALRSALEAFDGKAVSILSEIRSKYGNRKTFVEDIVTLAAEDDQAISGGATWLLKNLLEDGVRLTESQTGTLIDGLDAVTSWQAQLHICQSAQYLEIAPVKANACAGWLLPLLQSERPFLRAWSMDALQHLASTSPKLKHRARAALDAARQDPAASVRARARRW